MTFDEFIDFKIWQKTSSPLWFWQECIQVDRVNDNIWLEWARKTIASRTLLNRVEEATRQPVSEYVK
jgi:hypothetical protein